VGQRISKHARLIWGCSIDPSLEGQVKILLIVTGAKSGMMTGKEDAPAQVASRRGPAGSRSYGSSGDENIDFVR